ncbi:hypothetical protein L226DRAFT_533448 [Lentinus tigrinus ALCF2SS1-7]|uniref:uncharacterized protein n=1 Tax=Lentinus tigrinus ALCF2SS1-7 TaxID=1328758 RepID=UPI0011661533|nr:hypothetical protein L226DRAFT_533448 [Lentinus tigrinus ALCF2SS1-7]
MMRVVCGGIRLGALAAAQVEEIPNVGCSSARLPKTRPGLRVYLKIKTMLQSFKLHEISFSVVRALCLVTL